MKTIEWSGNTICLLVVDIPTFVVEMFKLITENQTKLKKIFKCFLITALATLGLLNVSNKYGKFSLLTLLSMQSANRKQLLS